VDAVALLKSFESVKDESAFQQSRNCFGRSLAIRLPVPAAAIIAVFMKKMEAGRMSISFAVTSEGDYTALS
jgi:hypothetical protein